MEIAVVVNPRETPRYLRAEVGRGTASEVAQVYRAIAVRCLEQKLSRVLIVVGEDEPAGEHALRVAATVMVLAGLPPRFRLALVATSPRVVHTYRNVKRDLTAVGVTTNVFESEEQAARWLEGADAQARRASAQEPDRPHLD
jgi:hypothetical protein